MIRGAGWWPRASDGVLAFGLVALSLAAAPGIGRIDDLDRSIDRLAISLAIVAAAALAWRARPVAVLTVTGGCTALYLALGYPYGPVMLSTAVAVYTVARRLPSRQAVPWCSVAAAALLLHLVTSSAALPVVLGFGVAAWVVVPASAGTARRAVLRARAHEQDERDRRLVAAERLRVAHDVHDIVGHGLAAIGMQADIALHLRETRPEQAWAGLEAISRASADALAELREALSGVTSAEPAGPVDPQPLPDSLGQLPPSLDRLDELRQRVHALGVPVHVDVTGVPRALPRAVDVVAYRFVQEALTNIVRHAVGSAALVTVQYEPDVLRLRVSNDDGASGRADSAPGDPAAAPAPVAEGFGITGMRRRAQDVGGTVLVEAPTSHAPFAVEAVLPLDDSLQRVGSARGRTVKAACE